MYSFHATIHVLPASAVEGPLVTLRAQRRPTLQVSPQALAAPFAVSFEQVEQRLATLPRMFCEPDGSFVWVSASPQSAWQLDGNLYDRGDRLLYVDLKGTCPRESFDQFLATLGWPETPLAFQLAHEAVLLDETTFRAYAGEADSPGA